MKTSSDSEEYFFYMYLFVVYDLRVLISFIVFESEVFRVMNVVPPRYQRMRFYQGIRDHL